MGVNLACLSTQAITEQKKAAKLDLKKVQSATVCLLQQRRFEEACRAVCTYEAAQFYQRGIGVDWHKADKRLQQDVACVFEATPKFHVARFGGVSEAARMFAAMSILWGTERFEAYFDEGTGLDRGDLALSARMLCFFVRWQNTMAQVKSLGGKIGITILACNHQYTTCEACLSGSGRMFTVDEAPELPHEECTCAIDCRCFASA